MTMSDEARRLWQVAEALNRAAAAVSPDRAAALAKLPPLMFFTDPVRTPEPWTTAQRLPAGAAVVYRAFGAADAAGVARTLRRITAERGVKLLIGLDDALAGQVGADGVHLPERALTTAVALRARHPDWLLTGAVHAAPAVDQTEGLDALVLSPVFAAGGSSGSRQPLGVAGFDAVAAPCRLPVYALGGVSASTADALVGSRACGLCGIDGVVAAFGA